MRRDYLIIVILLICVIALLTFGSKVGLKVQAALRGPLPEEISRGMIQTLVSTVEGYGELKTIQGASREGKTVGVYSEYPFNFKDEMLIAAGTNAGVKEGDAALFEGNLLGIVEKVFKDSALVRTIFDSRFKTQVRIGPAGSDALLVGGNVPKLSFIPSTAELSNQDAVYAVAPGLPYGLSIGVLDNLRDSTDSSFRDANLKVVFNPAAVHEVTVVPKPE